tara:strand:- start:326 stop:1867 length:1542 start_codon:yes stop_codon:yes gene_type:complete
VVSLTHSGGFRASGFVDALKNAGKFAINPLVDIEDDSLFGGNRAGRILEHTLEEMTAPVSILSMALAPLTMGASVGFRAGLAGGKGAQIAAARGLGAKLGQSAAIEGASAAGAIGLPEVADSLGASNQYVQMGIGLAGGLGAPAALGRGTAIAARAGATKRNMDEAADRGALFRADPTAANRAASIDFEVVGPYGGVGIGRQFRSADFQMLKPGPGKKPVDLLSRLPERSELIIEPRRLLELEDNLPAQRVFEQFGPNQRYVFAPRGIGDGDLAAMAGAGDVEGSPGHFPSHNLGLWWHSPWDARNDLKQLDSNFREGYVERSIRDKRDPNDPSLDHLHRKNFSSGVNEWATDKSVDAWRTTYRAGEPMRDALRKASGSDEIVLYRGQYMKDRMGRPHEAQPPQIVEGYSPLPEKAAAFAFQKYQVYDRDEFLNTAILVRRVKIDDIVGVLGDSMDATSEFVVLNPLTLSGETMKAITGRLTRAGYEDWLGQRVWKQKVAGLLDVPDVHKRSI